MTSVPKSLLGDLPILDASPNAVVAVDERGVIVYANPKTEATFGWPPQKLRGKRIEELLPHELADRHRRHRAGFFAHSAARPMGIGMDLAGRRRDGTEFPVEISLAPVDTPSGRLVFATVVDIAARKALEAQLLQAQKMESVGRLAGGIAHDFNNMLFAIRGYAELLREDLEEAVARGQLGGSILPSVEGIVVAADRATALTAQLLAFSRRQTVHPVEMSLRDAVGSIEPMLRRLVGERVRLVISLDPATGVIRADPGQLDQILVNLAVNARDAMPDGGTLTIETGNVEFDEPYAMEHFELKPGHYAMLAVSDTGQGMDQETRRHVFEPFFTTKAPGKGTGLGLATIYGIVRQGGGHIWLYSEPGRGTTFKLYFPMVGAPETVPPERRGGVEPSHAGRVLLVEDEPAVRDLTRRVLERAGYAVYAPEDTRDALEIVESATPIDVLVTDMVMPGLSGADLAKRAFELRPETAVLILSGYATEDVDTVDLTNRGAVFASKPLGNKELLAAVDAAVVKTAARR